MSIRRMIPMGTQQRLCFVCGYLINATDDELTAHEAECIKHELEDFKKMLECAALEPEQDKRPALKSSPYTSFSRTTPMRRYRVLSVPRPRSGRHIG